MIFLLLLFVPNIAHAYLDPASGSAILYIIVAAVTSLIFYSRSILIMLYAKILMVFKKENLLSNNIVIYSEGKQYWNTFNPLIKEFLKNNDKITYLTSSKDDPAFQIDDINLNAKYIGNEVLACSYLNYLTANLLITTTPQLDVFTLKKTKKIKHYVHVVHAPIDVHTYRKFAFDFYDTVMCSGPHQIKSIRALESSRNTNTKNLLETGLLYYDNKSSQDLIPNKNTELTTILIAPTWKEYSLLNQCGEELITQLLDTNQYKVILRPHPQSFVSFRDLTEGIISKFESNPNFKLDREKSGENSMQNSDLMISDLSGIVWDYIFIYEKPVILFETPSNLQGFEDTEIPHLSWEKSLIKTHLKIFKDVSTIQEKIELLQNSWNIKKFQEEREQSLFNFQNAAPVAYKQIKNILKEVN